MAQALRIIGVVLLFAGGAWALFASSRVYRQATLPASDDQPQDLTWACAQIGLLSSIPLVLFAAFQAAATSLEGDSPIAYLLFGVLGPIGMFGGAFTRIYMVMNRSAWRNEVLARGATPGTVGTVACPNCGSLSERLDTEYLANSESREWTCLHCGQPNVLGPVTDTRTV